MEGIINPLKKTKMSKKEISLHNQSLGTMAKAYGWSAKAFNENIIPIRKQLDRMVGRKNYRNLTPKQVELIINHLGQP